MKYQIIIFTCLLWTGFYALGQTARGCGGFRYAMQIFSEADFATVKYGENLNEGAIQELFMDVYAPVGDTVSRRPVLILVHGGDFQTGDRSEMAALCERYATYGYVAATIDYRLRSSAAQDSAELAASLVRSMQDLRAAVRFFRADARDSNLYRSDSSYILVGGYGPGAMAALHAAYWDAGETPPAFMQSILTAEGGLEGQSNNLTGVSSKVQGVLNLSGALLQADWIQGSEAPLISFHGIDDEVVPYAAGRAFDLLAVEGSERLHQQAGQVGIPNQLTAIPAGGHTDIYTDTVGSEYDVFNDSAFAFFERVVCTARTTSSSEVEPIYPAVEVFPNPARHQVTFRQVAARVPELRLFDFYGREVLRINLSERSTTLSLQSYEPGLYFYQLRYPDGGVIQHGSLVIQP